MIPEKGNRPNESIEPEGHADRVLYRDVFFAAARELTTRVPEMSVITEDMAKAGMEGRAVTYAAGLAKDGRVPVLAMSPSFLLRALDEMMHDVCLPGLHVVFAIEGAGLPRGGESRGIFTLSYLGMIPGLCVLAPKNRWELEDMLSYAVTVHDGPIAICYPDGPAGECFAAHRQQICPGVSEFIYDEKDICLLAVGSMVETALSVRASLRDLGYSCSLVNVRSARPLDEKMLQAVCRDHRIVVTMEENVRAGGFGDRVLEYVADTAANVCVLNIALPDDYLEYYGGQGDNGDWKKETGTDAQSILMQIIALRVGKD